MTPTTATTQTLARCMNCARDADAHPQDMVRPWAHAHADRTGHAVLVTTKTTTTEIVKVP